MLLAYSLTELEKLLAEESKVRVGYEKEGEALIKASVGSVRGDDGIDVPCVIVEVALPEAVAKEVMPTESKVKKIDAAGTVRGRAKGKR